MSNCISEIAVALQTIAHRWIQFPVTEESRQAVQMEFMEKFGFPGVIGAIDGTHVAILQPVEDEHVYFNRKGFHSKNVQIICDANLLILNVNANLGGSAHDSFIWRNSDVHETLEDLYQSVVIGDSGYPLQPWLFETRWTERLSAVMTLLSTQRVIVLNAALVSTYQVIFIRVD
jgi:hypothetical protein